MKALRRFARRLLASVLGRRDDQRVRDELAEHLALLTEDHVRSGLPLDEARRLARLELGATDAVTEANRDEQRLRWLEDFGADLRYGVRTLRRAPGFAAIAIVTLALGIGANTAIFSVIDAVILRRLPVDKPERLIVVDTLTPRGTRRNISFPLAQALRRETDVFAGVLATEDDLRRYDIDSPDVGADPIALIAAAAIVSGVAAIAVWIPAYRASRIQPVVALRQE